MPRLLFDHRCRLRPVGPFLCLALSLGACVSVPDVEQRLQAMQFQDGQYVVQAGDTLASIAFRYELDPARLAALNPGVGPRLRAGMRLRLIDEQQLAQNPYHRPALERADQTAVPTYEPNTERADVAAAPGSTGTSAPGSAIAPSREMTASSEVITRPVERADANVISQPGNGGRAVTDPYAAARANEVFTEIPAAARSDADLLPSTDRQTPGGVDPRASAGREAAERGGNPWPREEVVADDLDLEPLATREGVDQGSTSASPGRQSATSSPVDRWVWPTRGQLAREFAPERIGGQGVDIAGVPGQDVRAAARGKVVYSGRDLSGGGNLVIVRHDDELMTTYSHTDKLFVVEDDLVDAGDPIASLGWNDERESVLRFEVRRDGKPLNPLDFLPES